MSRALAAVILGAGASSRMGRPKLLLPWEGTTVIGHLVRQWGEAGAGRVTVVLRPGDGDLETELDRIGVPPSDRIFNPEAAQGEMFSSIRCAARWPGWREETTAWAVSLGDQPHLRTATLRGLVSFFQEHQAHSPGGVCQPSLGGRARHPAIVPREGWRRLAEATQQTFRDFLEPERRLLWPCDDPGLSLDLDTPEDYRRFTGLAASPDALSQNPTQEKE